MICNCSTIVLVKEDNFFVRMKSKTPKNKSVKVRIALFGPVCNNANSIFIVRVPFETIFLYRLVVFLYEREVALQQQLRLLARLQDPWSTAAAITPTVSSPCWLEVDFGLEHPDYQTARLVKEPNLKLASAVDIQYTVDPFL
jgi:hypothetical protein